MGIKPENDIIFVGMTDHRTIYIYKWPDQDRYLFPLIFEDVIDIRGVIGQDHREICNKVAHQPGWFLFHIDLTDSANFIDDRDELCAKLLEHSIVPLNAKVVDISKRNVQSICARLGLNCSLATGSGDPEEVLIVKTNQNDWGQIERKLSKRDKDRLGIITYPINKDVAYGIMHRRDVPDEVWSDENYVVERYITNKENLFYRAYKLRERLVLSEAVDDEWIKIIRPGLARSNYYIDLSDPGTRPNEALLDQLIGEIDLFCNCINLEYGAIDIVRNDKNEFFIIDANNTPTWNDKEHYNVMEYLRGALS